MSDREVLLLLKIEKQVERLEMRDALLLILSLLFIHNSSVWDTSFYNSFFIFIHLGHLDIWQMNEHSISISFILSILFILFILSIQNNIRTQKLALYYELWHLFLTITDILALHQPFHILYSATTSITDKTYQNYHSSYTCIYYSMEPLRCEACLGTFIMKGHQCYFGTNI